MIPSLLSALSAVSWWDLALVLSAAAVFIVAVAVVAELIVGEPPRD